MFLNYRGLQLIDFFIDIRTSFPEPGKELLKLWNDKPINEKRYWSHFLVNHKNCILQSNGDWFLTFEEMSAKSLYCLW